MTLVFERPDVALYHGDCRAIMATLAADSVDAIVTDPPYGLEFMGKEWDKLWTTRDGKESRGRGRDPFTSARVEQYVASSPAQVWHASWAIEALRVLKPGAHLVAFGGTRTYHRLTCALEDAGFDIRDCLMWLYGSGFPKSLDVSKAIDKAAGAEREIVGANPTFRRMQSRASAYNLQRNPSLTTDAARQWDGWGTALKPSWEPVVLARKPLSEPSVAANVQRWGTGALNIDASRIGMMTPKEIARSGMRTETPGWGRWPANLVLSHSDACELTGARQVKTGTAVQRNRDGAVHNAVFGAYRKPPVPDMTYADPSGQETIAAWTCVPDCPVRLLDAQSGERRSAYPDHPIAAAKYAGSPVDGNGVTYLPNKDAGLSYSDGGGASRFFYTSKASAEERDGSRHPTIKPLELMKWLVRLITPAGGCVLDPFMGSGSTIAAARAFGLYRVVGIDQDAQSVEDAVRRLRQEVLAL